MKVSFTGTRKGMNEEQKTLFEEILKELKAHALFHGDCIGADNDAHVIANALNIEILKRPCVLLDQRAHTKEGICIAEPEQPLDRNKKLVDDGEILVATPAGMDEEQRSGTWSTIRYARKVEKPIIIIFPNGHVLT